MKIAILTSSIEGNQSLADTAKKRGHTVTFIDPTETYQFISENEKGYDQFFHGIGGEVPERILRSNLDCVINRIGSNSEYSSSVLRFIVENLDIYCPNSPIGIMFASNKAWTLQRLSSFGLKVPRTIVCDSPAHVKWAIDKLGSLPIIVKTWHGSMGKTVGIIDSKRSANSMFSFILHSGLKVLLEEYIESDSTDIRAWVVGDSVSIAMKRTSGDKNDFRANISTGGKGEKIELSEEDKKICIRAATCLGLHVAGVDLMKSKINGKTYVIEVNSNPGTKIIDVTGHNVWNDVLEYCEKNYKKGHNTQLKSGAAQALLFDDRFFGAFYKSTLK